MKPRGSLRRFPILGSALAFVTGLLLAGVLNVPGLSEAQQDSRYAAETTATLPPAEVAGLQNLSEAFASVAEAVKPSLVFVK